MWKKSEKGLKTYYKTRQQQFWQNVEALGLAPKCFKHPSRGGSNPILHGHPLEISGHFAINKSFSSFI